MNPIASIYIDIAKQAPLSIGAINLSTRAALAAWAVCVDVPVTVAKNAYEVKLNWDNVYKAEICKRIAELSKYVYVEKAMVLEYARGLMAARAEVCLSPMVCSLEPFEDLCDDEDRLEKAMLDILQVNLLPRHDEMASLFESGRLPVTIVQSIPAHIEAIAPLHPEMGRDEWSDYSCLIRGILAIMAREYEVARTLRVTSEVDSEWIELLFTNAWRNADLADAVTDIVEDRLMIEEDAAVEIKPLQLVQGYRL